MMDNIVEIVLKQKAYFALKKTLDVETRIASLKKLKELLIKYEGKFLEPFKLDFNKGEFDVLSTEYLLVLDEVNYMIKKTAKLASNKKVKINIINQPGKGYLTYFPYGVVLIMAPWNYPLQLSLMPLIGAIAAGNTVILKPSSYAKNVSSVIKALFDEFNEPELIYVVEGGRAENQALLEQDFDYIFFTGGETVGRLVYSKAAEKLIPCTLELGGKSPCIVDEDADIQVSAKRIVWGKYLNAGQTCVAPDYICVHEKVHDEFVSFVKKYINEFYYDNGVLRDDFPHLINEKHLRKVLSFIEEDKVIVGGKHEGTLLEPTVMDHITFESKVMQEEIFGPIMPIISFNNLSDLLSKIEAQPKPLAFYYFTKDKKIGKKVASQVNFGGGCINEVVMHLTNEELPFGGVGASGLGKYHGRYSFETFSHTKSLLVKGKKELSLKYPPHKKIHLTLLRKIASLSSKKKDK